MSFAVDMKMHIPHSRPRFGSRFSEAVTRVLNDGHVATGAEALALEQDVATFMGMPHAVAVDSGTSALMLAVRALRGVRTGFKVGVPAYVCHAVPHAVRAAGAVPQAMDCGPDLRLEPDEARKAASSLDAVVLVHPFGYVEPLVAETWPCPVIEDIAQGAGSSLEGRPVGCFGDITVLSFYATKPWGGAAGGMVLSRDASLHASVRAMCSADDAGLDQAYAGNHQLSDIHAVMARTRLTQAEAEQQRRRQAATALDELLGETDVFPVRHSAGDNWYRYIVRVSGDAKVLIGKLRALGVHACRPVPARPDGASFPGAARAWDTCVSLPLLSNFRSDELQYVRDALKKCLL